MLVKCRGHAAGVDPHRLHANRQDVAVEHRAARDDRRRADELPDLDGRRAVSPARGGSCRRSSARMRSSRVSTPAPIASMSSVRSIATASPSHADRASAAAVKGITSVGPETTLLGGGRSRRNREQRRKTRPPRLASLNGALRGRVGPQLALVAGPSWTSTWHTRSPSAWHDVTAAAASTSSSRRTRATAEA